MTISIKTIAIAAFAALALSSCAGSTSGTADTGLDNPAIQNIMNRKSVRSYSDQQVTDEQMTTLLKAAMAAPSGMDVRPWSFVVLRDASKYEEIFSSSNFNLSRYQDASAVVVICADTTVTRQSVVMPNGTWRDDLGACTENFLLAAESMGLGAVWTACYPYPDRMNPVKEALGLPSTVVPYCVVPVGYADGENQPKDKWDETRVHYDRW